MDAIIQAKAISSRKIIAVLLLIVSLTHIYQAEAAVRKIIVQDGTTRRVETPTNDTVNLYVGDRTVPFKENYGQGDPPYVNGCGPVAAQNLFYWYGMDHAASWDELALEMATNHAAEGIDTDMACTLGCGAFPPCIAGCIELIHSEGNKGTRPSALINYLKKRAPPGFKVFFHAHDYSLANILNPLSEGNPVIAMINTGNHINHYVVITGIFKKTSGEVWVRLANNNDLHWPDFVRKWSLVDFGNSTERSFMDEIVGDKPYLMAYYSEGTNRVFGQFCMEHNECVSKRCDSRPGAGCVGQDDTVQTGQFCTTHQQCRSQHCEIKAGKIAGTCTGNFPLGHACVTHNECVSKRCDSRPGAGCVGQDNTIHARQFCTTHQQCRSQHCEIKSGKIAGTCTGDFSLGHNCVTHNECISKRCDNRPGAGCVGQDNTVQVGQFCTTHQQCRSGFCDVTPNRISGKCRSR